MKIDPTDKSRSQKKNNSEHLFLFPSKKHGEVFLLLPLALTSLSLLLFFSVFPLTGCQDGTGPEATTVQAPGGSGSSGSSSGGGTGGTNQGAGVENPSPSPSLAPSPTPSPSLTPTPSPSPSQDELSSLWKQLNFSGVVSGGIYAGALLISIDPEKQAVIIRVPLPIPFFNIVGTAELTSLPGASYTFEMNEDETNTLALLIPLKYLLYGANLGSLTTLPNGSPLPYLSAQGLTGFSIDLPQKSRTRLHFYLSVKAAGVFVETPGWEMPPELSGLMLQNFIKNPSTQQVVGVLAIVPNKGEFSSGVFVAAKFPEEVSSILDKILRY